MSEPKQDPPLTGRLAAGAAAALAALTVAAVMVLGTSRAAEPAVIIPAPAEDSAKAAGPTQTAVLAGGCFWGVQGVFEHLTGVKRVLAGYAGGDRTSARYEIVGTGGTGHAESVQITYDPQQVTYGQILQVFFSVAHDPTELNRQGPDSGSQYRSSIFYGNETQQKIAQAYIQQLNKAGVYHAPIVTRVDPLKGFYAAEGYHQDFLLRNPSNGYIVVNDLPKIENFRKVLPSLYAASPAKLGPGSW
jgi:peptide-methionine (S)-S-oxide reductase